MTPTQPSFMPHQAPVTKAGTMRGTPFAGRSLVEMLEYRAAVQPEDLAYTFLHEGETPTAQLTWSELAHRSRTVAAALQTLAAPGDRALLLYPPGLDFIAAFFGCLCAGVIAVPVQPPLGGHTAGCIERLNSIATDAQPRCTLTNTELLGRLMNRPRGGNGFGRQMSWTTTDGLSDDLATALRPIEAGREAIALLQYTSGSTACPKGVMVSHGNLLHNLHEAFHLGHAGPDGVSVSWLPVTHDMGLIEGVLQPAFSGCPAYLMSPGAFLQRPGRWLGAISRYGATRSGGPNFAYDLTVSRVSPQERTALDLRSWRTAYNGAEPVRAETMEAFATAYEPAGFDARAFRPCYGLAESTLLVSTGRWSRPRRTAASVSCGRPAPGTRVRIVDPAGGRLCSEGEIGEIQVSGPSVAHGYWRRPLETSETFGDGARPEARWLRTGDLGCLRRGELHVTGRIKDLLIVRGAKHFPQDIERTAERQHEAIRKGAVAAVAVAAGVRGDQIALIVEVDPRRVDADTGERLLADLRQAIAERHGIQLHGIALVTPGTVPKTTSGKLRRFLCRDAWRSDTLAPLARWTTSAGSGPRPAGPQAPGTSRR